MSTSASLQAAIPSPRETAHAGTCRNVSLLGGPLHRAGRWLGLVRAPSNTVPLGLAIGASLWLTVVATTLFSDAAERLFSLPLLAVHVRLLVVIPLLFWCESLFDPRVRRFFEALVDSGTLPPEEAPAFAESVARLERRAGSWLADAACLTVALISFAGQALQHASLTAGTPFRDAPATAVALAASLVSFRFLLFRWAWRLVLWGELLRRLSRLALRLVPTHPDRAGGLGGLEIVQFQLLPLVVALSATLSAATASELASGTIAFASVYPLAMLAVACGALLVLLPLVPLIPLLLTCRQEGLTRYMSFAVRYVDAFERKWLSPEAQLDELLGTPDLQSLADLGNSVSVVRDMRLVPVSLRLMAGVVLGAVVPQLPLLLFEYSLPALAERFFARLLGG